jgi:hypothetical protein
MISELRLYDRMGDGNELGTIMTGGKLSDPGDIPGTHQRDCSLLKMLVAVEG